MTITITTIVTNITTYYYCCYIITINITKSREKSALRPTIGSREDVSPNSTK